MVGDDGTGSQFIRPAMKVAELVESGIMTESHQANALEQACRIRRIARIQKKNGRRSAAVELLIDGAAAVVHIESIAIRITENRPVGKIAAALAFAGRQDDGLRRVS